MAEVKVFTAKMAQELCVINEHYDKEAALRYAFDTIKDAAERGKHSVNLFTKYFAGEVVVRMQAYQDVCQQLEEAGYRVYVRFVEDNGIIYGDPPYTVISWVAPPHAEWILGRR